MIGSVNANISLLLIDRLEGSVSHENVAYLVFGERSLSKKSISTENSLWYFQTLLLISEYCVIVSEYGMIVSEHGVIVGEYGVM